MLELRKVVMKTFIACVKFACPFCEEGIGNIIVEGLYICRSCSHFVGSALEKQMKRVRRAGFSPVLVNTDRVQLVPGKDRHGTHAECDYRDRKVVIPYYHSFSNSFKSIAIRFGIILAYRNDLRLSILAPFLRSRMKQYGIKHKEPVTPCQTGIVYSAPV